METHIEWTMPAPLWTNIGDPQDTAVRRRFRTPTLLRFANDDFMDEFTDLLNVQPERLSEFVALPETWSSPPGEPVAPPHKTGLVLRLTRLRAAAVRRLNAQGSSVIGGSQGTPPQKTLKLFQPVHQRFYLVSACLVCRTLGLPDRRVDTAAQERVTFVIRMLQPHAGADPVNPDPEDCDELALVGKAWQPVGDPTTLTAGETQYPLSPAAFTQDDQRTRRLFVGMVPVGQREALLQATQPAAAGQPAQPAPLDPRQMLLKTQVIAPWKSAEDIAKAEWKTATGTDPSANPQPTLAQMQAVLDQANDRIQTVSWYILLDLARYFQQYLPALWQEIQNNGSGAGLPPAQQTILTTLTTTSGSGTSMVSALKQALAAATQLESVTTRYSSGDPAWPSFHFQFSTGTMAAVQGLQPPLTRDVFESQIVAALPPVPPSTPQLPVRLTAQASANPQAPVWFSIRCVLERPNCPGLTAPFLSEPTVAFQLAAYFDSDAPARPIRIGLPIDTTPAGLRKFDKNTAFVMSDTLCGQVNKMSGMSFADLVLSVLPFPFHQGLDTGGGSPCPGGGMVCSFSIPIITICALILLIIFIKLLDIIFFWMPFFQICLPLPNFSAKDS